MTLIDQLGFGPKRTATQGGDGLWRVTVTPPAWAKSGPGATVTLTQDQYARYLRWQQGVMLIQDALPDLSPSQREVLMTGLDDSAFKNLVGEDDDDA